MGNKRQLTVKKLKAQAEAHSSPRLMSKHMQKQTYVHFSLFNHG